MKYLIGIDSGGTLTKAGLYDADGKEVMVAQEKFDVKFPREGMNERDFHQFRQANINVIKNVITESGIDAGDIAGALVHLFVGLFGDNQCLTLDRHGV